MSLSGLCEVCQRRDVDHTCDRCGNLVCDVHFDPELNVCSECLTEVGQGRTPQPDGENLPDGVDTYEF